MRACRGRCVGAAAILCVRGGQAASAAGAASLLHIVD
jgi:hypothetical protein